MKTSEATFTAMAVPSRPVQQIQQPVSLNITSLPADVLQVIMLHLHARERNRLSRTCRTFRDVFNRKIVLISTFRLVGSTIAEDVNQKQVSEEKLYYYWEGRCTAARHFLNVKNNRVGTDDSRPIMHPVAVFIAVALLCNLLFRKFLV